MERPFLLDKLHILIEKLLYFTQNKRFQKNKCKYYNKCY